MSVTDDNVRIRHMLDAAQKAVEFTVSVDRKTLDEDEKLALSLVRLLEIIGEAAATISEEMRESYPDIPWQQIAATRNRLIHGYYDVDLNIVWEIVSADLPQLIRQLNSIDL